MKHNDTTRRYPRTMQEAWPNTYYDQLRHERWEWMEGHRSAASRQAEFWVYIVLAFAAGFLTHMMWGAK